MDVWILSYQRNKLSSQPFLLCPPRSVGETLPHAVVRLGELKKVISATWSENKLRIVSLKRSFSSWAVYMSLSHQQVFNSTELLRKSWCSGHYWSQLWHQQWCIWHNITNVKYLRNDVCQAFLLPRMYPLLHHPLHVRTYSNCTMSCAVGHAVIVPCCDCYLHIVPWGWHGGSFYTRMLPYMTGHSWWQQCHCHGHRWRMDDRGGRS